MRRKKIPDSEKLVAVNLYIEGRASQGQLAEMPQTEAENRRIAEEVETIHMDSPDKGYRRIRDDL